MVRLEDLNITFLHIPKNAGTSIESWLVDNCNGDTFLDELRHEKPYQVKRLFDDIGWSFCVIRNPFERVVSWYKYFHSQGKITIDFHEYVVAASKQRKDRYLIWPGMQKLWADDADYIIRYENLKEDFKVVQDKVKCWKPLDRYNSNDSYEFGPIKWNKTLYDLVCDQYAEELYEYNYEFGGNT